MSSEETTQNASALTVDRLTSIRDYVERMIALVGEHPECELKKDWRRNTPYHRAEVVKDIQATANSAIAADKEKYIVIGADEETRTVTGCNPADYDDASFRQLLEQYLDPVPEFETLSLRSSAGLDFVVLRFPFQEHRPIIAKGRIQGDRNQIYLDVGQIWIKPGGAETGSTGKRLLNSRQELINMINIEPRVRQEVEARIQQVLPEIRLEERTRLISPASSVLPVFTATDEEFESYVEQLLVAENLNHLNITLERLRDRTVEIWDQRMDEGGKIEAGRILEIRNTEFLPAIRRLVLLGLLLIKLSAPTQWFSRIVDLMVGIFSASHKLRRVQFPAQDEHESPSLAEHSSFTVPALEALLATDVLAAYALVTRGRYSYIKTLFPRNVQWIDGSYDERGSGFLLFWPLTYRWGTPNVKRQVLISERYGQGDRIESLFGDAARIEAAALQVDCLVDWHSVLAQQPPQGDATTSQYFRTTYAGVNNSYNQNFTIESLMNVVPIASKIWDTINSASDDLFLDASLARVFNALPSERRKELFAQFLVLSEQAHGQVMWNQQRFPFRVFWEPQELRELVHSLKAR